MRGRRYLAALILALALCLAPTPARAEELDGEAVYALCDESGAVIAQRAGRIYEGDEYIASDNSLYRVTNVDDGARRATAAYVGQESPPEAAVAALALADEAQKLVAMYATHSDESYEQGDGDSSLSKNAGIYDVCEALKAALEEKGVTVELDETSHLPHDAKAYSRSRRTAEDLLHYSPDALLDIHRDGIPDEGEYETSVDGEETSKVRLLVGRSNPNSQSNREFAKTLKAAADEKYPGLVKDIFIGKGNYNQELYPKSILLEFGTHTLDKERAVSATGYMADVLYDVLYGSDTASAAGASESAPSENKSGGLGILWLLIAVVIAVAVYALVSHGSPRRAFRSVGRGISQLTGGLAGKKPDRGGDDNGGGDDSGEK